MSMRKVGKCGWDAEVVGNSVARYEVIIPMGASEVALPVPRDITGAPDFDVMQAVLVDALIALNEARKFHTEIPS